MIGTAVPPRYLVAYLRAVRPDREVFLRFPPGMTLEDAGLSLEYHLQKLASGAVDRLRGFGVEVVAVGQEAVRDAFLRASAEGAGADVGAFADDYLGVNARLGGDRCVTVWEYAMSTRLGDDPLRSALRDRLIRMDGVRTYCGAAFREGDLPDTLRLRLRDIAGEMFAPVFVPCRLHGDRCRGYPRDKYNRVVALLHYVGFQYWDVRVAVPRGLLDDMRRISGSARPRAAREIARRVLGALPESAWQDSPPSTWRWSGGLIPIVAAAMADTCEEYTMLVHALRECRSAREVVRRARDASWVVSRALERLRD